MNKENNIYTIKRIRDIKKSSYNEESYRKALEDERIKELLKTGSFTCEYFSTDKEYAQRNHDKTKRFVIDPLNACAKIIEINDDNIVIEVLDNKNGDILKEILETDIDSVRACMRAIMKNNKNLIIKTIIGFDIVGNK